MLLNILLTLEHMSHNTNIYNELRIIIIEWSMVRDTVTNGIHGQHHCKISCYRINIEWRADQFNLVRL